MYDTPKAAHFIAFQRNKIISNTYRGFGIRWQIAHELRDLDMLRLTNDDRTRIQEVLDEHNKKLKLFKIRVELCKGEQCTTHTYTKR